MTINFMNKTQGDNSWIADKVVNKSYKFYNNVNNDATPPDLFSDFKYLAVNHDQHEVINRPQGASSALVDKPYSATQVNIENLNLAMGQWTRYVNVNSIISDVAVAYVNTVKSMIDFISPRNLHNKPPYHRQFLSPSRDYQSQNLGISR